MSEVSITKKVSTFEKRIHEIDFARGLLMVLVIMDHLFYLLRSYNKIWMGPEELQPFKQLYGFFNWYWTTPIRKGVQWAALASFCFISGISSAFSRNNWKRAIEMIILWAIVFVGSNVLDFAYKNSGLNLGLRDIRIDLNIIGVLAFSTLIYCFFQKKDWYWLVIVAVIGFVLHIGARQLAISDPEFVKNVYCPFLWKPNPEIAPQADYMPLFPYISFFFLGALLTKFTYGKERKSYFKRHEWERPICFLGRHSLIVYITHYGLLVGIFALINLIFAR